jgi:uncharacterized membrane protein
MELLAVVAVCVLLFLLIGVPWIAIAGRSRAVAAQAGVAELVDRVARLQQQIDALRADLAVRQPAEPDTRPFIAAPVAESPPPAAAEPIWSAPPPLPPSAPSPLPPSLPPPLPAAPPAKDFEELIGTRWAIWVGGLALALGALFLVKLSIDAGFFGPGARILLAGAFSAALVAGGELLRRGALLPRRLAGALPPEHAPLALAAAGTVGLFGTVYAAHALYGFIPQAVAFVLLGLIGVAAMAASLLHGQALAGLGLVGAYAAPILIGGDSDSRWPVVIYLLVVTATGLAVDRRLRSSWLGWAVIAGVAAWTALLILGQKPVPTAELAFMLVSLALAAASFCWLRPPARPQTPLGDLQPVVALAGLSAALGLSFVVHGGEPTLHAAVAAVTAAIIAVTAARDGRAALAIVAAALLPLGMLLTWPGPAGPAALATRVIDGALLVITTPARSPGAMAFFALVSAAVLALPPLALALRRLPQGARHAAAGLMAVAIAGGLAAPLITLAGAVRSEGLTRNLPAAAILAALCLALALATDRLLRQPGEGGALRESEIGAGGYAAGAALSLGLAIAFALPGLWMAVGFGLAALAGAALNDRWPLPMLRRASAAFATTALLRAIGTPVFQPDGAWPLLNSYLFAYGLPALLLAAAALLLSRQRSDRSLTIMRSTAALMGALFLAYEIRHAFHGADLNDGWRFGLGESGLYALAALGAALALHALGRRLGAPPERLRTLIAAINLVGLGSLAALALLAANPWLGLRMDGPFLLDSSFVGYLLPAIALGLLAYLGRTRPEAFHAALTGANRIIAIGLGYLYVLAQTRRAFAGLDRFAVAYTVEAEQWAYSLVTLAFGVGLLAIGFRLGSRPTRLASAVFVIIAVLKVFIIDMAALEGLLRALSFMALGGVLIGIGLAYQRLLFDRKPSGPPPLTRP